MATNDSKPKTKNQITLIVIVGGTPIDLSANEEAPLHSLLGEALAKSGNVGQNPTEWEFADKEGNPYDPNKTIEQLGLASGSTIYLSRKAGGGG